MFTCKMCGGKLKIQPGKKTAVCEYCGTLQTIPNLDSKKENLYDRANHYRRNNDYDRALLMYEQILAEDKTDAEAYWSIILCRYGIEYVEDPATHKRIPTIHRAQYTSVLADEDFKAALQYASEEQKAVYQSEAKTIDEIQKNILLISKTEKPFDVFICYKETDDKGDRTEDSVLGQDLYSQLTAKGFRVFFSRISLEDKLGTAYEPYIFAALNSAKVMVVIGTRIEYINAVWVRNEWSRYLVLMQKDNAKTLIPAYKGLDPYELPEAFSHLQAQDMSKLGFMQDLVRGIEKIVSAAGGTAADEKQSQAAEQGKAVNNTVDLGFMDLRSNKKDEAVREFKQALKTDISHPGAYIGIIEASDENERETYVKQLITQQPRLTDKEKQYYSGENGLILLDLFIAHDCLDRVSFLADMLPKIRDYGLFYAISVCKTDSMEILLKKGVNMNAVKTQNDVTYTYLPWAVDMTKNAAVVRKLLEHGARADSYALWKTKNGTSKSSALFFAIRSDSVDIVKLLLDKGADVNEVRTGVDDDGCAYAYPMIYSAIYSAKDAALLKLMLEHGADSNALTRYGDYYVDCPVSLAVNDAASLDMVKLLMEHGANLNVEIARDGVCCKVAQFPFGSVEQVDDSILQYLQGVGWKGADVHQKDSMIRNIMSVIFVICLTACISMLYSHSGNNMGMLFILKYIGISILVTYIYVKCLTMVGAKYGYQCGVTIPLLSYIVSRILAAGPILYQLSALDASESFGAIIGVEIVLGIVLGWMLIVVKFQS
jgi:tetratricopeptide (TPR) repeat protein